MIPELGTFALSLALALASIGALAGLGGGWMQVGSLMQVSRVGVIGVFLCLVVAMLALGYSFVIDDFSVQYVTAHSNTHLPMIYKVSAIWGGHEGSLLLWVFLLSVWAIVAILFSRSMPDELNLRAMAVLLLLMVGFLVFMLFTSNPFDRMMPAVEGRDLNPLLQDPGLAIHPPMLYMGYVGFAVPFAYVMAALLTGRLDATWARWSRPWTLMAWMFLTIGIALGSWWAYYELGWGGWWFWDPVENASFMPWLMGTALIHTLAITEKRGGFKSWTVLLAIFTFSLSLLGTFLVRSGVLVSVHAFANDPERGVFILIFLGLVLGLSFLLFLLRINKIYEGGDFGGFARETFLLINNVLLVIVTLVVLFGTLFPLIIDTLGMDKVSVGPPYFNSVFVPLMLPLSLLIALGIFSRWRKDSMMRILKKTWVLLAVSIALGLTWAIVVYELSPGLVVALSIALMVIVSSLVELFAGGGRGVASRLSKLSLHNYGKAAAHIGIGVFIIGATVTSHYSVEKNVRMSVGTSVTVEGYEFIMKHISDSEGPNYIATGADIMVKQGEKQVATLHPQKRIYRAQGMPMTEAAIDTGWFRDVYVAMGEPLDERGTVWAMRLYVKPYVSWLWLGAALMALGGLLAGVDRRYRLRAAHG
jgi:cytochrome c-type biogenesis protein CcmF